jgi:uncharacterized BrkB/YihY/UPF0761 family membrane protein
MVNTTDGRFLSYPAAIFGIFLFCFLGQFYAILPAEKKKKKKKN